MFGHHFNVDHIPFNVNHITEAAKEINSLIENKNYEALENYLANRLPAGETWASYLSHSREGIMPFAVKARDAEASHRFYYDQFDSADRLFLAPFYNNNNDPNHEAKSYLLLDALRKNCVQEIKYWHERKLYLDLENNIAQRRLGDMDQPFIHCCRNGFNEIVEYLIRTVGHSPNEIIDIPQSYDKSAPLVAALTSGKIETADLLLSLGADVNLWVGLHIGNKKSVDLPIVHHVVDISTLYVPFMNNPAEENPMDAAIAKFREPSLKWLLEHGATEFDSKFAIKDDYPIDSREIPALATACASISVRLARILLDLQREKWINKGGALLELLTYRRTDKPKEREELRQLFELIIPLVDPATKKESLANAMASAIRFGNNSCESFLAQQGADLKYMTKTEKYHYGTGRSFDARLKLSRNGIDVLTDENEEKDFIIDRVAISTRTSKIPGIRKKMTNIAGSSPLFFELTANNTDPNKELWEGITGYKIPVSLPPMRELKLLDKENGKIYNGNESTLSFILGRVSQLYNGLLTVDAFSMEPAFISRFALFCVVLPVDMPNLSLPKGYRIIYKPVTFPQTTNLPVSTKSTDESTQKISRSKRTFDELQESDGKEQPNPKRRKTRK